MLLNLSRTIILASTLCCPYSFAALSPSAPTVVSSKQSQIEGTLQYASLKYWVETVSGQQVELLAKEADEPHLMNLVAQHITLTGTLKTYSNGGVYFEPTLSAPASADIAINPQDDGTIVVAHGEQVLLSTDMYHSITINHEQPLAQGKAVLLELNSGGIACPVLYQLAVIRPDALPLLTPTFGTCSDLGKLKHDANGFTLVLPGNPAETWAWDSRTMALRKQS